TRLVSDWSSDVCSSDLARTSNIPVIGGERDDRDIARARNLPDRTYRLREERTDDDFRTFRDRLLGADLCTLHRATIILHQQLNVGTFEFRECHFSRVLHRLSGNAGIALTGERQDQRDAHLAFADGSIRGSRLARLLGYRRPAPPQFLAACGEERSQPQKG